MSQSPKRWGLTTYQILRLSFGIGLLVIIGVIYLPYLFYTYSSNAVVSARIVTLTTPIDGIVAKAPPQPGQALHQGDVIAEVINTTVDRSHLGELEIEKTSLMERIKNLEKEEATLIALQKELIDSKNIYISARTERIVYEIAQATQRYQELTATATEQARKLDRNQTLYKQKNVSVAALDDAYFSHERTKKAAEQAKTEIERLKHEMEQIKKGIFINQDGRSEVVYQDQRIDEIRINLANLEAEINSAKGRLTAVLARITMEQSRIDGLSRRSIRASGFNVVLRSYVMQGSQVDEKTKLLDIIDCGKVYIDMTMHEGYFEKIKVGERVSIKLRGQAKVLHGTVSSVRGGSVFAEPDKSIAGVAPQRRPHEMQVIIDIDEGDLYESAGDLCHVGRTGEVTFEGLTR